MNRSTNTFVDIGALLTSNEGENEATFYRRPASEAKFCDLFMGHLGHSCGTGWVVSDPFVPF